MKIEFLNADCTEAIVTRGWFAKRQAHVVRVSDIHNNCWAWRFVASERRVVDSDWSLARELEHSRGAELIRRAEEKDWRPVTGQFPKARLLKRCP